MQPRQIVSAYFLAQAIGTAAWWVLLAAYPPSVKWFQPNDWPAESLTSFWLADFVLIVAGSIVAGVGDWRRSHWSTMAVWMVAVVTWYPTLVCIATSIRTDEAWVASSMMASMAGLSLAMATIYGNATQSPATIRVASMSRSAAVLWTLGQIIIFWGTFLWVLPLGILEMERHFGWTGFTHDYQPWFSVGLFAIASGLGLWSGLTMAKHGDGTPLPTATTPRLVVAGPYRYVRNPMAVAGIVQGIAAGWYLGSVSVILLSFVGALLSRCFGTSPFAQSRNAISRSDLARATLGTEKTPGFGCHDCVR